MAVMAGGAKKQSPPPPAPFPPRGAQQKSAAAGGQPLLPSGLLSPVACRAGAGGAGRPLRPVAHGQAGGRGPPGLAAPSCPKAAACSSATAFPAEIWLFARAPPLDATAYRLRVGSRVFSLDELVAAHPQR